MHQVYALCGSMSYRGAEAGREDLRGTAGAAGGSLRNTERERVVFVMEEGNLFKEKTADTVVGVCCFFVSVRITKIA